MRFSTKQKGFSTVELLITLLVFSLLMGAAVSAYSNVQKYRRLAAANQRLNELQGGFQTQLNEDVRNAGAGLKHGGAPVVTDLASGKSRPAVFVDDTGQNLTVINTNEQGSGDVLRGDTSKLLLFSLDWSKWESLAVGSMVLVVNPTAAPALFELQTTPRKANDGDLPPDVPGLKVNFERSAVVQLAPLSDCWGLKSLGNSVEAGSYAVPVTRVIRYWGSQEGFYRSEDTTCQSTAGAVAVNLNRAPLAPSYGHEVSFAYLTASGASKSFPSDPSTLLGIETRLKLVDPTIHLEKEIISDAYVSSWK
ncbi:MAG: hypothetical protein K1Y36_29350, partial [Blastocatellia bacterium]|nr:hypothetical protein [Blastocatellia bacterium]